MTIPFPEDEEDDELLLGTLTGADEDDDNELEEVTLDDVEELEEEASIGHKVQTFDPEDDGVDDYFDERYFDE